MDAITYSAPKANLAMVMDRVCGAHEPLIITRHGEQPSVVMLTLDAYKALEETAYLQRCPANAKRQFKAVPRHDRVDRAISPHVTSLARETS